MTFKCNSIIHACMLEKNVQTTLPEITYEGLARLARRRRRPIKLLVREAVEEMLRREASPDEDPLLGLVSAGRLEAGDWSERKDWRG